MTSSLVSILIDILVIYLVKGVFKGTHFCTRIGAQLLAPSSPSLPSSFLSVTHSFTAPAPLLVLPSFFSLKSPLKKRDGTDNQTDIKGRSTNQKDITPHSPFNVMPPASLFNPHHPRPHLQCYPYLVPSLESFVSEMLKKSVLSIAGTFYARI